MLWDGPENENSSFWLWSNLRGHVQDNKMKYFNKRDMRLNIILIAGAMKDLQNLTVILLFRIEMNS